MAFLPPDQARTLGALSTVGLSFVLALVIGVGVGLWFDRQFASSPWGLCGCPQRVPRHPHAPMTADVDPVIRRIERTALAWCVVMTVAALVARPDRPSIAAGIVGGGLLAFVSLFAIRATVDAVLAAVHVPTGAAPEDGARPPAPPRATAGTVLKLTGRFGLLAVGSYVMIARLRLHPVGLLIGATSLVAGATLEAVRGLRRP
jgi:hypothetical protein